MNKIYHRLYINKVSRTWRNDRLGLWWFNASNNCIPRKI